VTPSVAAAYALVAGFLYALSRASELGFAPAPAKEMHQQVHAATPAE
jgi:hypothetical protein